MKYTIEISSKSIAKQLNTTEEFVIQHWDTINDYIENFERNSMNDILWENAEEVILEGINMFRDTPIESLPTK
jgi:hypothetical protein